MFSIDWDPNNSSNRLSEFLFKHIKLVLKMPKISDEYYHRFYSVIKYVHKVFDVTWYIIRLVNLKKKLLAPLYVSL